MTDILQNGTTWLSLNHDITDKNYWISEVIVGSDPKKKAVAAQNISERDYLWWSGSNDLGAPRRGVGGASNRFF